MKRSLSIMFSLCVFAAMLLPSCKQSSSVVSDHLIQKRKHRSGWLVDLRSPSPKPAKREASSERISQEQGLASTPRISEALSETHHKRPNRLDRRGEGSAVQSRHVALSGGQKEENSSKRTSTLRNLDEQFPAEEEEEETPESLSLIAKLLAVLSSLLAVGTFITLLVFVFGAGVLSSTGVVVLISMAVLAVLGILLSLLFSYIILEKYDDDVPMQWTLFASYVFEAILAVFFYMMYIGLMI
ncbi:MAG: hypothetical protein RLP15_13620 [Cryomorphaceae bacterium]